MLAKEKLCPVVAIFPYRTFEEAVARAKANLLVEGAGHSAALHSNDEEHIRQMGVELPVSRLVVNQASALTAGGSLTNGFAPTTTLGCGSWGGNSISENLDYKHLMNVSRIGKPSPRRGCPRMRKSGRDPWPLTHLAKLFYRMHPASAALLGLGWGEIDTGLCWRDLYRAYVWTEGLLTHGGGQHAPILGRLGEARHC